MKTENMTWKHKLWEREVKKCRSFRKCLSLNDYHFKQVDIGQHIEYVNPMVTTNRKPTIIIRKRERNTSIPLIKTIKPQGKKRTEEEKHKN